MTNFKMTVYLKKSLRLGESLTRRGFTLIELLIVIAILGVLAVVILVAINPQEQLARTRDAGRTSTVTQLGHAMQAYGTSHEGNYIAESATWISAANTGLVASGEIATTPANLTYNLTGATACDTNADGGAAGTDGWCYDTDGAAPPTQFIVFARLESGSNNARCPAQAAWVVFDSVSGRGGIVCTAADATNPAYAAGGQTFIN